MTRKLKPLIIIGAGGHGRSVAEAVELSRRFSLFGFVDDGCNLPATLFDAQVFGGTSCLERLRDSVDLAVVAIGNNAVREQLHQKLKDLNFELAIVIHPSAFVSRRAEIGAGTVVMAGAQVGVEARLGEGVILNSAAVVDHHCIVEDYGHLGTNASMAGGSLLGRGAWMQAGSCLGYGVRIAAREVLAVGEGRSR
jgi:sugar O-acyltransferase (sialic acid O-acetyltransferase NeuD family)